MDRKTDYEKVKRFSEKVKKQFPDAKIFFFGSRVSGEPLKQSDFDIIVVSRYFERANFFSRTVKMYDYWSEQEALEVFCYTPEEFEEKKKRIGIVKQAVKTAKIIA